MKLVIQHSATKRAIDGPFSICGSKTDLAALAEQIRLRLQDESWSYGWMTVYPVPGSIPNTHPVPWD